MRDRRLTAFARALRRDSTDAERRIWALLRANRLSGHSFRRQHPIGQYIADFYCRAARLVVELDGGQHADPASVEYDRRRAAALSEMDIHVIRFSNHDALKSPEAIVRTILHELESRL